MMTMMPCPAPVWGNDMKFDVFKWNEVKTNAQIQVGKGVLRLRVSAPCPLYLQAEGVEALVGVGTSFDVEASGAVSFRVEAPEGVRAFREQAESTSCKHTGEVFTNIDRMPDESGSMAEVLRARRLFEFEQRSLLREMRSEREALLAARAKDEAPAEAVSKAEREAVVADAAKAVRPEGDVE